MFQFNPESNVLKFDDLKLDQTHLYEKTVPWDFSVHSHASSVEVAQALVKLMLEQKGYGIAANQCGLNYSIFAMRGLNEHIVAFNPKIVYVSPELTKLDEGCLSYPGLIFENMVRPAEVRLRFQTPNGQTRTERYTGMTARVIQHEMMHLEGKAFFEGVSKLKIALAIKKAKKRGFNYDGKKLLVHGS